MNYSDIKVFLTDCDGVLTDGGMYYFEDGNESKKFNTKDGMGFRLLRENGIKTGIITGEKTVIVKHRAKKLKLDILYQGVEDKKAVLDEICKNLDVNYSQIAYIGDDINDIDVLAVVGLPACPADAHSTVKPFCKYITQKNGGDGVIREVVDLILNT